MAFKLGDAVLFFRGDHSQLEKDVDQVERTTKSRFGNLGGALNSLIGGALVTGVGAAVAGLGAVGAASLSIGKDVAAGQRLLQTELGLSTEKAEEFGKIATDVFANNFGASVEDAAVAVAETRQQLRNLSDNELQAATQNAFRFADAFDEDMGGALNAANVLMEQFGLTQQEAFDLLTSGYQRGLNASGDFLDTISEYGGLFGESGANASEFFSILETGLQGGVLGTDKVADAFKEFQIRLLESGEATGATIDDFNRMLEELRAIEDPIKRNARGVELFGTQWEDLGASALLAVNSTKTAMDDLAGATEGLDAQYAGLGDRFEGLKRQALVALAPIGEQLLGMVETVFPIFEDFVGWLGDTAIPWIVELFSQIQEVFIASDLAETFEIWRNVATTAIREISAALGLGNAEFSTMELIVGAVTAVITAMSTALKIGAITIGVVAQALTFIISKIKEGIEAFQRFGEQLNALGDKVPDWLKPGSPPPLANALGDIGSQLEALNKQAIPPIIGGDGGQAGAGLAPAGAPAAAGGGGPQVIQLVVDGEVLAEVVNTHLGRNMRQAEMLG